MAELVEFRLPSLGADMEVGTVLEWRVGVGDQVARGDIVALVDTEKSEIEVEIWQAGVVRDLLVDIGQEIPVGTPLALLEPAVPAGTVAPQPPRPPAPPARRPGPAAPRRPPSRAAVPVEAPSAGAGRPADHRVVSPLVRRLAAREHVDLTALSGTGPGGVVTRHDVEAAHAAAAAAVHAARTRPGEGHPAGEAPAGAAPARLHPRSSPLARRLATELGLDLWTLAGTGPGGAVVGADVERARREQGAAGTGTAPSRPVRSRTARAVLADLMSRSKREIPHYYLTAEIDLAAAMAWLASANETRGVQDRLVPAALLLKATAVAAARHPELNGFWRHDCFEQAEHVHLGVAVSQRDGGLVAPAIHDADRAGLDELMAALRDLVLRARAGRLRSSEMADPTITVSNLGDRGVDSVYAVIYPPQVAMIGFGRIGERPTVVDGQIVAHPMVTATLSADHRVTTGHTGARLLATIDSLLQRPEEL